MASSMTLLLLVGCACVVLAVAVFILMRGGKLHLGDVLGGGGGWDGIPLANDLAAACRAGSANCPRVESGEITRRNDTGNGFFGTDVSDGSAAIMTIPASESATQKIIVRQGAQYVVPVRGALPVVNPPQDSKWGAPYNYRPIWQEGADDGTNDYYNKYCMPKVKRRGKLTYGGPMRFDHPEMAGETIPALGIFNGQSKQEGGWKWVIEFKPEASDFDDEGDPPRPPVPGAPAGHDIFQVWDPKKGSTEGKTLAVPKVRPADPTAPYPGGWHSVPAPGMNADGDELTIYRKTFVERDLPVMIQQGREAPPWTRRGPFATKDVFMKYCK